MWQFRHCSPVVVCTVLLLTGLTLVLAQEPAKEKKFALLVGINKYQHADFKEKDPLGTWAVAWNDAYPFTAPVGSFKKPNAFGLHDMHGNVGEWCADWCKSDYYKESPAEDPPEPSAGASRVIRGGSFYVDSRYCRAADRSFDSPSSRYYYLGFRVAVVR